MSRIIDEIEIYEEAAGLITSGKALDGTIPTTAGRFAPGCTLLGVDGITYKNSGTTASPSWDSVDSISTSEIAAGAVTLAKLASGVTPSHIVKFFRLGSTITTTGLVGVAVGDLVVTIVADGTVTVGTVATVDTLPADPADTSYVIVLRAAA
jgi:hypothetical protein